MMMDWFYVLHGLKSFWQREDGVAAVEAALLFPPLVLVMAGVYDVGNGIILSGRTITASQVAADLLCRQKTASLADVNDTIVASQLVYQPYALKNFGIDIVSIEFDSQRKPKILWRQTRSMNPNTTAVNSLNGVGAPGEGMVIVSVQYTYKPLFSHYFTKDINMREVSYGRGRRSPTVEWSS